MKIQIKILVVIIPFVLLALMVLGLWSFNEARESSYRSTYRYLENVLESYVEDQIILNYQLLKNAKLDTVVSYVDEYQQVAKRKAKEVSKVKGGHIFILNEVGETVFSSFAEDHFLGGDVWKDIARGMVAEDRQYVYRGFVENESYRDVYTAQYFKPWGWVVFYSFPDEELTGSLNKILLFTFAITALCALGVTTLVFIFSRIVLVTPIDILKDAALKITSQQRIEHIAVHSKDELGTLARSMEAMSQSIYQYKNERVQAEKTLLEKQKELELSQDELKRHHDSLEIVVAERTVELQQANQHLQEEILERKREQDENFVLESRLQQSQKMESVGTLAGGIAHDFNNLLAVILGFTELAREEIPQGSSLESDLNEVLSAGHKAKELVQQILAFSRQTDTERRAMLPGVTIEETIKILRSTLPSTIDITQNIAPETGYVLASPTELNQVIMNLGTNAFHAMEKTGGTLDFSLQNIDLDAEAVRHEPDISPGSFVEITVRDTGVGIDPEVCDRIFEPYFTTKQVGRGTGLGLSIIHGIIKRYGGFISLQSTLNEGTAFSIFLPVVKCDIGDDMVTMDDTPTGTENILFVDDEVALCRMGKSMLERLGYNVLTMNSSQEALQLIQDDPDRFDLVITDQTMPVMTGVDFAEQLLAIRPNLPVILCTGYSSIVSDEKVKNIGIKGFAFKPVSKNDFGSLIRKTLDSE